MKKSNVEDRDINQKLHEAIGKCWHGEQNNLGCCNKCGQVPDWHLRDTPNGNPAYDSELTAAFDLVEWMRKEKGFDFEMGTTLGGGWNVEVWRDGDRLLDVYDPLLPRAIALAAIRALEVK